MKIIVDTNIIFSLLLNPDSKIGNVFFKSDDYFEFYSSSYMKLEIDNHWNKLLKISKITEQDLLLSYKLIISIIRFIEEEVIPKETWLSSREIANDIDIDDIAFIALTTHLSGVLWTGDKVLYNGLRKIDFKTVANSNDLLEIKNIKSAFGFKP